MIPFITFSQIGVKIQTKININSIDNSIYSDNPYYNLINSSLGLIYDYSIDDKSNFRGEVIWNVRTIYGKTSDQYFPAFAGDYILDPITGNVVIIGDHPDYTLTNHTRIFNPFDIYFGYTYLIRSDLNILLSPYASVFNTKADYELWESGIYYLNESYGFIYDEMVTVNQSKATWLELGLTIGVDYELHLTDFPGLAVGLRAPLIIRQLNISSRHTNLNSPAFESLPPIKRSIMLSVSRFL